MHDASRAVRTGLGRWTTARPALMARARLFVLLLLLLPLFAGLQYLVEEGMPRVEIHFVSEDVPVLVPVERVVERIVERVVYVPDGSDGDETTAEQSTTTASPPLTATPALTTTPAPSPSATPGADVGPSGDLVAGQPASVQSVSAGSYQGQSQ